MIVNSVGHTLLTSRRIWFLPCPTIPRPPPFGLQLVEEESDLPASLLCNLLQDIQHLFLLSQINKTFSSYSHRAKSNRCNSSVFDVGSYTTDLMCVRELHLAHRGVGDRDQRVDLREECQGRVVEEAAYDCGAFYEPARILLVCHFFAIV